jgi:hypothetical protein
MYNADFSEENYAQAAKVMEEYHKIRQVSFQFSHVSIISMNFGAGAWLFGVLLPLTSALC